RTPRSVGRRETRWARWHPPGLWGVLRALGPAERIPRFEGQLQEALRKPPRSVEVGRPGRGPTDRSKVRRMVFCLLYRVPVRPVPKWTLLSSGCAPLLLAGGWTVAGHLEGPAYDPVTQTISVLAAQGAAGAWVMTAALMALGSAGSRGPGAGGAGVRGSGGAGGGDGAAAEQRGLAAPRLGRGGRLRAARPVARPGRRPQPHRALAAVAGDLPRRDPGDGGRGAVVPVRDGRRRGRRRGRTRGDLDAVAVALRGRRRLRPPRPEPVPGHRVLTGGGYSGGVGVSWVRYIAWTSSSSWTVGPTTAMPRASMERQLRVKSSRCSSARARAAQRSSCP